MQPDIVCPNCGNSEGHKIVGHEVRGVYDGVLFWHCLACGKGWPREFGVGSRNQRSQEWVDRFNSGNY